MNNSRRRFVKHSAALTAGSLIVPSFPYTSLKGSLDKFGIQLYTLREVIPQDPKGTIKKLSDFGFKQIEGFEGRQGMFWNMPHKDFKMFLDDVGVEMISSHCNIHEGFEEKAEQAAEIGMKYLICPYIGPQKSVEKWKEVTELFNKCGEICRKNGIRFAYHNHEYTFRAFSGMIPQEYLMDNTDPELVDHQMDIYWVVTGGGDPIDYIERYPGRFRLCHVKDRLKNAGDDDMRASCDLGTGSIDFPSILKKAADKGMEYFIMEQERYDNSTPMKSAEHGAKYLKELKFG